MPLSLEAELQRRLSGGSLAAWRLVADALNTETGESDPVIDYGVRAKLDAILTELQQKLEAGQAVELGATSLAALESITAVISGDINLSASTLAALETINAVVTATDLNIRNLSSAQDSVTVVGTVTASGTVSTRDVDQTETFTLKPNVSTITDSLTVSNHTPTSTNVAVPEDVGNFARNKDVGGFSSWALSGRAVLTVTPPANAFLINASGAGSVPGTPATFTTMRTDVFSGNTFTNAEVIYRILGSVQVGCDSNLNPSGFTATVRIIDGSGDVLATSSATAINPSVSGLTYTTVTASASGSLNSSVVGGVTPDTSLRVQLSITSIVGATVSTTVSQYWRQWTVARTVFSRLTDGTTTTSYASATASATSTAATATPSLSSISYPGPTFGSHTHTLQAYVSSLTLPSDPLTGATTMQITSASSMTLTGTISSTYTFLPSDFGSFTRLRVQRAYVSAGSEFRFKTTLIDGVDTPDPKGRISGITGGPIDFDSLLITKGYLASSGSDTPILLVQGVA